MDQLPTIVQDLALILVLAGIVTLIFKWLRQPLILGYIVAGFICGPHLSVFPTVVDTNSVSTWAEIGVIFLMFTLGLEFSFKKLIKMGPSPVIAACTIIFCMIGLGSLAGHSFGWNRMNSLFLGGMLAMSSTTVIYKALDDMGLRHQRFASSVLGALVVEDILGILLMVILSTMAVSSKFEGSELVYSLLKLMFVLVLWFTVGVFLIPTLLRKARSLMSSETLLVVSLGLCFLMVVIAVSMGYSAAFGAFMMGSILAETIEAEQINTVVAPVKDLFGAIFFVSVGMMVDPSVICQYWVSITVLVLLIIVGQAIFGTTGFILAGQPLKTSIRCGFSMAQIGEFAFIIAALGVSLKVTEPFLYPVVVAVSVITTFLTPYMIRLAPHVGNTLEDHMPSRIKQTLRTDSYIPSANNESTWRRLIMAMVKQTLIYSVLSIAMLTLSLSSLLPLCRKLLGHWYGNAVCGIVTLLILSLFVRAIVMRKNHSDDFRALWNENIYNRFPLIFTIIVRFLIGSSFIFYLLDYLSPYYSLLHWIVAFVLMGATMMSHRIQTRSKGLEDLFLRNLKSRDIQAQRSGEATPTYANQLLTHDVHLAIVKIPMNSTLAGTSLRQLDLPHKSKVMVVAIVRSGHRINVPGGDAVIFPGDKLQIIGSDSGINTFSETVNTSTWSDDTAISDDDMVLRGIAIGPDSTLCDKAVCQSRLREDYGCMLVGFEEADGQIGLPDAQRIIRKDDRLWLVGEKSSIHRLLTESNNTQKKEA